jgi:hypothetical protein
VAEAAGRHAPVPDGNTALSKKEFDPTCDMVCGLSDPTTVGTGSAAFHSEYRRSRLLQGQIRAMHGGDLEENP